MDGNKRWVSGDLHHPDRDPDRREFVAQTQEPFGSILSCIDSRVPPELLFDTGLGDLYAAYESIRDGKPLPGNLEAITKALRPAYEQAVREGGTDPVETMARAQVTLTAADLRSNQDLAPLVGKGALAVVGAYYSLDTGKVEVLAGAPS